MTAEDFDFTENEGSDCDISPITQLRIISLACAALENGNRQVRLEAADLLRRVETEMLGRLIMCGLTVPDLLEEIHS